MEILENFPKEISEKIQRMERIERIIRSPQSFEVPFIIFWETTYACDLACLHCRAEASPIRDKNELSFDESKKLLEDIRKFGRPIVVLTGGDPFKRDDIFNIISYGISIGLPISLSPSITPLFSDDKIELLKKSGVKTVSISLDGPDEETHDSFRGVQGVFRRTLDIWQKLTKSGIKVQINTTVSKMNLGKLPHIFSLIAQNGAMIWSVFFIVETGRANQNFQILPQDFEDVMNFLYDCGEYIHVKTTEGHHFKRIFLQRKLAEEKGEDFRRFIRVGDLYYKLLDGLSSEVSKLNLHKKQRRTPMNVNAGRGMVFISKTGKVFPSGFLPVEVGSVRQESIVEIYKNSPLLRKLRDFSNLKGKCRVCEFREFCGGSRSRAYAHTKDMFESEPFCIYQPKQN